MEGKIDEDIVDEVKRNRKRIILGVGKRSHIINETLSLKVKEVFQDFFTSTLSPIRQLSRTHWQTETTELSKGCDQKWTLQSNGKYSSKGEIDNCDEFIVLVSMKNILDFGERVVFVHDLLV